MAEGRAVQDTGNPVLDSTVNIVAGTEYESADWIRKVHSVVMELAAKEPGGLKIRARQGDSLSIQAVQKLVTTAPKRAKRSK